MQEAKDSSEIENIVTTQDEIYRGDLFLEVASTPAAKEVQRYATAMRVGYDSVRSTGLLTANHILEIQSVLKESGAGLRKLPGTVLKDAAGAVVYTPPQDPAEIVALMTDLERCINDPAYLPVDPLIKMAVSHHQFESIHPFYDGNGRTGRIVNVLYLVKEGLLDLPILSMSRQILRTKADYYRLLRDSRASGNWEEWIIYVLDCVEKTAIGAVKTITAIREAMQSRKEHIRHHHKFYSQDLLNSIFQHPYTKIEFMQDELKVSRPTATKYLEELTASGVLAKEKRGRSNYYINTALWAILIAERE